MCDQSETFRLLQPGLMSTDELKYLLSQRGITVKSIDSTDKHRLVELYECHLMPLSQRNFPKSHQGMLINKKILDEERKQKKDEPNSRFDFQYGFKDNTSGSPSKQLISHPSSRTGCKNRLKPPIDSASVPSKKICLSRRPSSDKDLDKIIINDRSKRNSESSSDGRGRESTHKQEEQDADKISPIKRHSSPNKDTDERNVEEPKPKRRRIGWP